VAQLVAPIISIHVAGVKEHRKEVEGITGTFTRAEKTRAASISNKLAVTDHVSSENQLIDWENVKIMDHESDRTSRVITEAIITVMNLFCPEAEHEQ